MTHARLSLAVFAFAALAPGCAKPEVVRTEPAKLRVVSEPNDASVYVDGHYFGRAKVLAVEPKALVPGVHLMTVTADQHFPHDLELDLPPGLTTVDITLRPIPP